jgi:hypothetical protein
MQDNNFHTAAPKKIEIRKYAGVPDWDSRVVADVFGGET